MTSPEEETFNLKTSCHGDFYMNDTAIGVECNIK